jgi:hypothetical protein
MNVRPGVMMQAFALSRSTSMPLSTNLLNSPPRTPAVRTIGLDVRTTNSDSPSHSADVRQAETSQVPGAMGRGSVLW